MMPEKLPYRLEDHPAPIGTEVLAFTRSRVHFAIQMPDGSWITNEKTKLGPGEVVTWYPIKRKES